MIKKVCIESFKSIERVELELGRINVFIGENGAGKSNLLEGIAIGAAARAGKSGHEYLAARGIRLADPAMMTPAFSAASHQPTIQVSFDAQGAISVPIPLAGHETLNAAVQGRHLLDRDRLSLFLAENGKALPHLPDADLMVFADEFLAFVQAKVQPDLDAFLIYSPENSSLRIFEREGQILPLGVNGEGLFAHLKRLSSTPSGQTVLQDLVERLSLISWFERFDIPGDLSFGERRLLIRDRYLAEGALFDQRSANEGFLLLLFYLTLFLSPETPRFFAIDNLDASLNPKLCRQLMMALTQIAKERDKQALLTTHNPALLDGLDLTDDDQRLFVVERDSEGRTRARRIAAPRAVAGRAPVPLSEAFMKGYLGGLPKNF